MIKADGVKLGTYGGEGHGTAGWIEPDSANPSWILYWNRDGSAELYTRRATNGAVEGDPIMLMQSGVAPTSEKET